jgi:hypothetical protein
MAELRKFFPSEESDDLLNEFELEIINQGK